MTPRMPSSLGPERRLLVRPTIIVGLGGTGCQAAQEVCHRIRQQFGGNVPPFCKFLAVDTTAEEVQDEWSRQLDVEDFVHIGGFDASPYFEHQERYPFLSWLPKKRFRPGEISVGAQGIPQIGRFCYMMKREGAVYPAVQRKLLALTHPGLVNATVNLDRNREIVLDRTAGIWIHIIGSTCGGTGAGILLDMAYDLRRWCRQVAGRRPWIIAHLLMPETFPIRASDVQRHLQAVTYATLLQINHFMDRHGARIEYKDGSEAHWAEMEAPFDFCFLLGGASTRATTTRKRSLEHIGQMVATMAASDAGKHILDQMINVFPRQDAQGARRSELRVFSSYGLCRGRRPEREQTLQAFRQFALHYLAHLAEEPRSGAADPLALEAIASNPPPQPVEWQSSERDGFLGAFQQIHEKTFGGQADLSAIDGHVVMRNLATRFIAALGAALQQVPQSEHVADWALGQANQILRVWRMSSQQPPHGLRTYLTGIHTQLAAELEHVEQSRATVLSNGRTLGQDLRQKQHDDFLQQAQAGSVVAQMEECYREHATCAREMARGHAIRALIRILKELGLVLEAIGRGAGELQEEQPSGKLLDAEGRPTDSVIQLYQVDTVDIQQSVVATEASVVLKEVLLRLVTGGNRESPFALQLNQLLREEPETKAKIDEFVDKVIEWQESGTTPGRSANDGRLRSKMAECLALADSYWLIRPDRHVQEIRCGVLPRTKPLIDAFRAAVDEDTPHFIDDALKDDCLVLCTAHGAALRSIINFEELYEEAYRTTIARGWPGGMPADAPLHETMRLDKRWDDIRPPVADEEKSIERLRARVGFAFLLCREPDAGPPRLERRGQDGFFFTGTMAGTEYKERLGDDHLSVYANWCARPTLCNAMFAWLQERTRRELVALGGRVRATLPERLGQSRDPETRRMLFELEEAVQQQLDLWQASPFTDEAAPVTAPSASPPTTEFVFYFGRPDRMPKIGPFVQDLNARLTREKPDMTLKVPPTLLSGEEPRESHVAMKASRRLTVEEVKDVKRVMREIAHDRLLGLQLDFHPERDGTIHVDVGYLGDDVPEDPTDVTSLPNPKKVAIGAAVHAVAQALRALGDGDAVEDELRTMVAAAEKIHPEESHIGGPLERLLEQARQRDVYEERLTDLIPLVRAVVAWLGEDWYHLLQALRVPQA